MPLCMIRPVYDMRSDSRLLGDTSIHLYNLCFAPSFGLLFKDIADLEGYYIKTLCVIKISFDIRSTLRSTVFYQKAVTIL